MNEAISAQQEKIEDLEAENSRLRGELFTVDDLFRQSRAKLEDVQGENARLNAMVVCPEVQDLKAEAARLRDAIEWVLSVNPKDYSVEFFKNELRARAFPPKMETVEVVMYGLIFDDDAVISVSFDTRDAAERRAIECKASGENVRIIELKGLDQRPIPAKVKKQWELRPGDVDLETRKKYPRARFFAEWEE